MAEFKEELVINALHIEKAEVGKKYWYSNNIWVLKNKVETNSDEVGVLKGVRDDKHCFAFTNFYDFYFLLYPYEEPPKQRMRNYQLAEWCAKGNGQYVRSDLSDDLLYTEYVYDLEDENEFVPVKIVIRPFGESEWIKPTVDVYERDCKKE